MRVYGYPVLPRAGLGNMLFPWADCYLRCRDLDLQMIAPSWRKLRLGPLLRGERDRRNYHLLFTAEGRITGFAKWFRLMTARRVHFSESFDPGSCRDTTVVIFDDLQIFHRLAGRQDELRAGLRAMTKPGYIPAPRCRPTIGVHVRLGDYFPPGAPPTPGCHYRQELSWYREALREVRRVAGSAVDAVVYSDGDDDEVRDLLREENVTRSPHRSAVTDLLSLAESSIIIASRSTFSLWGSFLGQAPAVWHPESRFLTVVEAAEPGVLEPEWRPGMRLPDFFVTAVRARFCP